ncbi:MAG: hypothetical protein JWN14_742 [Chthonomonadales bacterium]|nr:hypothetical protein [Chthonomonadales bacterium]
MNLDRALQEHEEQVDVLLKNATRYVGALKAWKKACQIGHIGNLQKAATQAGDLSIALPETTAETRNAWDFDIRDYLASDAWRTELQSVAAERFSLRTLASDEDDSLISSPLTVHSLPSRSMLALGKVNWPAIRPRIVATELKRLRDRTAGANSQEFVESLLGACVQLSSKQDPHAKFRDIYDLFCLTPGYKKENPAAAFGQQIYALQRSSIRTTRGGRKLEIEGATGAYKEKDVFTVLAEDGRPIRYFGIFFK